MQRKKIYFILCVFLLLFLTDFPTKVSAQSGFQTFESNPIEYWNRNNLDATFNINNTITIKNGGTFVDWYSSSWTKRVRINITGSSGAGSGYALCIDITYDSDMQSDFDDIRFTDNDGKTLLWQFRHYYTASTSARYWVKVNDNLDSDNYIFMYYGNPSATLKSSGWKVFYFYDNFDAGSYNTTNWIGVGNIPTQAGGYLVLSSIAGGGQLQAQNAYYWPLSTGLQYNMSGYGSATYIYAPRIFDMIDFDKSSDDLINVYDVSANTWRIGCTLNSATTTNDVAMTGTTSEKTYSQRLTSSYQKFYQEDTLKSTVSTNIPTENMGAWLTRPSSGGQTWYINELIIRKWIATEPSILILSEQDISNATLENSYVDIPVLNKDSVIIKTMIEIKTKTNNESIGFYLNTSLGIDNHLTYTVSKNYNVTRMEINLKHGINIYRITAYTETQVFISRNQTQFINSKDVKYLRIVLNNFTLNSRALMFHLTGSVDYSAYGAWKESITTKDSMYEIVSPTEISAITANSGGFKVVNVSYFKEFTSFQFLRTYLQLNIKEIGTTYFLSTSTIHNTITIHVENITIIFQLTYVIDDDHIEPSSIKSYVKLYDGATLKYNPSLSYSGGLSFLNPYERQIKLVAWRTTEDNIGLAFGSTNQLFEPKYGANSTDERLNTFFYPRTINDFSGNITISHYLRISTNNELSYNWVLDQCEYAFNSDYGIAQPHFSSTWYNLLPFPFNQMFEIFGLLGGTINNILESSNLNLIDEFFDWVTGIGASVAEYLQPAFDYLYTTIVDTFGGIGDTLAGYIGDWGEVAFNAIVDILGSVASAIADFLVWFVDGIGALLGIANLATIISNLIANFVTGVTNFISGIVIFFSTVIDGFAWLVSMFTLYLPTALTMGALLIALHVAFSFATMDDRIIMNMVSFYARIFSKILEVTYSIANMIIQFIGGIIP